MSSNTIAAIATPAAMGGVSMIRISGPEAFSIAGKVFRPQNEKKLEQMKGYTAAYGGFYEGNSQIDDGVVLVYHGPKSYTGEDVVELTCHGGILITRKILRLLLDQGARMAQAGEFSKRAFLNGKMSLTQAESIMDLIASQNEQALKSARAQMDGALFSKIKGVKDTLLEAAAHLAAWVDFPEEDIEEVEQEHLSKSLTGALEATRELLFTFDTGKILREGIETAIVGKPNVGKSTLMNLLAGCEKSIVTDIAGTTRDVIEESVNLGNVVLRLADTAGIRQTEDTVEKYGVELALKRIRTAGLVLAVFDYSAELSREDEKIVKALEQETTPAIAVVNKTDLEGKLNEDLLRQSFQNIVYISANNTDSIKCLSDKIQEVLGFAQIDPSAAMLANERQRLCAQQAEQYLQEAVEALNMGMTLDAVTVSVEAAIESLLELTGERVTDAVVDQVFHHFCVGK